MNQSLLFTLDTHYQDTAGLIAVHVIPHAPGLALIDCRPGVTLPRLLGALAARGYAPSHVTDVLLTHIHLDHAGAAGWWAQQGARIHVHPVGAPHLLNPEKLLASAQRLYGDAMDQLWGAFLPAPSERVLIHSDDEVFAIGGQEFRALYTPGHAEHHIAYLWQAVCFSGDVGGVRAGGLNHVRLPTPPPEVHFEKWRASIARLRAADFQFIAPTHFGVYAKDAHFDLLERSLDAIVKWLETEMSGEPPQEIFRRDFGALLETLARADGYTPEQMKIVEAAGGATVMSADGIYRYWKKYRAA